MLWLICAFVIRIWHKQFFSWLGSFGFIGTEGNYSLIIIKYPTYRNDPKFSDRYAWANSADPDQTAPRGVVWLGTTLLAIPSASFLTHYSMVKPHSSNFRVTITNFLGVQIFRKFTVPVSQQLLYNTTSTAVQYLHDWSIQYSIYMIFC